jgi:dihydroflavonol-4-reductase
MSPVLITGATGFLGRHLVEQLAGSEPLRLLVRPPAADAVAGRLAAAGAPEVAVVSGDVTSRDDVRRAMDGVRRVYHLAGFVSRNPKDDELLYRVHVEGTRNVCEAALAQGVEKLVLVSSSGTVAVGPEPFAHDENSGYKVAIVREWPYYLSKIYAEKMAFQHHQQRGLPVVVVNPALLLGPGDERGTSTADVRLFLEGKVLAMPLGGMSFVDARDTAAGLIAAMRNGRPGERYLLGGPNWTFRRIIEELARITGRRPPRLQPSFHVQLWSGRLLRPFIAGLDEATIRMSALFWYVNSRKARDELGFSARDPLETLAETVRYIQR